MSDVAVIGAGYVGLTTAVCLAHLGHNVVCADIDDERVRALSKGEVPILEDGLPELSPRAWRPRRLRFVLGATERRRRSPTFVFLCVPTPQGDDGSADLSFVDAVAREIAPVLRAGHGRDQQVDDAGGLHPHGAARPRRGRRADRGGRRRVEPRVPARGHVGPRLPRAEPRRHRLQRRLGRGAGVASSTGSCNAPILVTDPASAEMIKYASNAFLATKISFVNAIANLCEAVDADVREVALGMGYDQRIGFEFLHPGPGLRRLVLPEGHRRAALRGRDRGLRLLAARGRRRGQPASSTSGWSRSSRDARRRLARRRADRGVGPHVQGQHRRPARLAGARDRAPAPRGGRRRCGPTTPPRGSAPPTLVPGPRGRSPTRTRCATGARRARRAHRVGRVPLDGLRPGAPRCCRRPPCSTPATSSTRPRCAGAGFTYEGVGR